MLVRWGIRVGTSLVGIAVGILVSSAVLSKFSIDATAVVEATLIFWLVHLVVQLLALRVLVHEPSIALGRTAGSRFNDRRIDHRQRHR